MTQPATAEAAPGPGPLAEQLPSGAVTACAVSGRLLAFATLVWQDANWQRIEPKSRMFHLGERSRLGLRTLAAQIHEFAAKHQIVRTAFCRTLTGHPDDEARIEALLSILPGLELDSYDSDTVLRWSARARPCLPHNVRRAEQTLVQLWAIDLAQLDVAAPTLRKHR